jgi:hypothetical protein
MLVPMVSVADEVSQQVAGEEADPGYPQSGGTEVSTASEFLFTDFAHRLDQQSWRCEYFVRD